MILCKEFLSYFIVKLILKIKSVNKLNLQLVNKIDSTFTVESKLKLSLHNNKFSFDIEKITPYTKSYIYPETDYSKYVGNENKIIFFAFENEILTGQIMILKYWNSYCYINDIRISKDHRGKGIGKALIEKAIEWAKSKNCIGLEAETQDVNVNACRFYEKMGFILGGVNMFKYRSSEKEKNEIALNWYKLF